MKPPIVPSDKMRDALKLAISQAWLANAETVYPCDAAEPDVAVMADVAALSAAAVFCEWMNAATGRNGPKSGGDR